MIIACSSNSETRAGYQLETVAKGLEYPWGMTFLPNGTMLITERPGRLRIIQDNKLRPEPVSGLPKPLVHGQGGYLDIIADPDFDANRRIYLSYAKGNPDSNQTTIISARLSENLRHASQITILFEAKPAKSGGLHFGSRFAFLADGSLVFGLGDGGYYRDQAQNLQTHLGKIIRIHKDGSIPEDNPFVNIKDALPEIYSFGHRNVQGIAYDHNNHILFATEHGPKGGDELNIIKPGANYGWPLASYGVNYSGTPVSDKTSIAGAEDSIWHWTPSIAVSGIAVYRSRDSSIFPEFANGDLLIPSLAAGEIHMLRVKQQQIVKQEILQIANYQNRIRHVAVSEHGEVFVLSDDSDSALYRLKGVAAGQ